MDANGWDGAERRDEERRRRGALDIVLGYIVRRSTVAAIVGSLFLSLAGLAVVYNILSAQIKTDVHEHRCNANAAFEQISHVLGFTYQPSVPVPSNGDSCPPHDLPDTDTQAAVRRSAATARMLCELVAAHGMTKPPECAALPPVPTPVPSGG